ncbi:MAG: hypothetical protein QS98_C0008G0004 [archaeon GW2011_AR3]|nr:MAG: hypothetical protein QS98_C0008G0004 [archaeon GW2011_AR3]
MNEQTMLKLSLGASLIGLFGLFIVSQNTSLPDFDGNQISQMDGRTVMLTGELLKSTESEKMAKLTVREQKYGHEVPVLVFKDGKTNLSLNIGSIVVIVGDIRKSQGKYSIIAEKVKILDGQV